jgi:hypothetical protein
MSPLFLQLVFRTFISPNAALFPAATRVAAASNTSADEHCHARPAMSPLWRVLQLPWAYEG